MNLKKQKLAKPQKVKGVNNARPINPDGLKINVPYEVQVGEKVTLSILVKTDFHQKEDRIYVKVLKSELEMYLKKYTKEKRDPKVIENPPKIRR
jgi:hypothetical protein